MRRYQADRGQRGLGALLFHGGLARELRILQLLRLDALVERIGFDLIGLRHDLLGLNPTVQIRARFGIGRGSLGR
jgi:hypothetical protein